MIEAAPNAFSVTDYSIVQAAAAAAAVIAVARFSAVTAAAPQHTPARAEQLPCAALIGFVVAMV